MAGLIKAGESIYIPFCNGVSIPDSQLKPRMYKSVEAFQKSFPRHYPGIDGVTLEEYAPVVHGSPVRHYSGIYDYEKRVSEYPCGWECPFCGDTGIKNFCPNCGAKMDKEGPNV